ncbi:MAG: hypothetical protein WAL72_18620, partial [Streptosporangiaceae bacterium]
VAAAGDDHVAAAGDDHVAAAGDDHVAAAGDDHVAAAGDGYVTFADGAPLVGSGGGQEPVQYSSQAWLSPTAAGVGVGGRRGAGCGAAVN